MRVRFRIRRLKIVAATVPLFIAPLPLAAQIVLQVKQGSIWTDRLSMADSETMYFRWKEVAREHLSGAAGWEMTLVSPTTVASPPIVGGIGGVGAQVPRPAGGRLGEYAFFQIAPNEVPSSSSRSLYVRVWVGGLQIGKIYSAWIPVAISRPTAKRF